MPIYIGDDNTDTNGSRKHDFTWKDPKQRQQFIRQYQARDRQRRREDGNRKDHGLIIALGFIILALCICMAIFTPSDDPSHLSGEWPTPMPRTQR